MLIMARVELEKGVRQFITQKVFFYVFIRKFVVKAFVGLDCHREVWVFFVRTNIICIA